MPSQVFFMDLRASAKETNFKKFQRLLEAVDLKGMVQRKKKRPLIAVKLHFGEKGNTSFIRPVYVRQVVDHLWDLGRRPLPHRRQYRVRGHPDRGREPPHHGHRKRFRLRGGRAPLVIADGLTGKAEVEVTINREQFQTVYLAEAIVEAEALVTLTHFKLHELSGFGGALKNLGMGCASRKGKLAQHSNISPKVTAKKCTGCGECIGHCAQEAIGINPETEKAVIDPTKCVGCAECILVCPYGNIQIQWNESIPVFLKKMMEYAHGVMKYQAGPERVHQLHHPGVASLRLLRPQRPAHRGGHRHRGLPGPGGHRPGLRRPGDRQPRAGRLRPQGPEPRGATSSRTSTPRWTGTSNWNTPRSWAWGPGSTS